MTLALQSSGITQGCTCAIALYLGWIRLPVDFPMAQIRTLSTLLDDPYVEPIYAEFHPHETSYWSHAAPIAPRFYPYNRCAVQQCDVCKRVCLSYVEAGGYYVEPRIRALILPVSSTRRD